MTKTYPRLRLDHAVTYQIKVQGRMDQKWSECFKGMTITVESGSDGPAITTMTGKVIDQAALYGLLNHIRDLGLPLVLVEYIG